MKTLARIFSLLFLISCITFLIYWLFVDLWIRAYNGEIEGINGVPAVLSVLLVQIVGYGCVYFVLTLIFKIIDYAFKD